MRRLLKKQVKQILSFTLFGSVVLGSAVYGQQALKSVNNQKLDLTSGSWIDLTHPYQEGMPHYPGHGVFEYKDNPPRGLLPNGEYLAMGEIRVSEHIGTHMDAPNHFFQGGAATQDIPLDRLNGLAAVIDVSQQAKKSTYQIKVEDVLAWEKATGQKVDNRIVFFYTGYSQYWGDTKKYFGTDDANGGKPEEISFPSIGIDLANWLVKNRKVKAVGLDVSSTDLPNFPSVNESLHQVHVVLAKAGIPTFENVANLHQLVKQSKSAWIFAFPMKVENGTGGPTRIAAFVPK
jgi:kynurenine formamidase